MVSVDDPSRKPRPGMALAAKSDFPEIEFSRSIMVGDSPSDVGFGESLGMHTVGLTTSYPDIGAKEHFKTLYDFARAFVAARA